MNAFDRLKAQYDSQTFGYKRIRFSDFWLQKGAILRFLATKGYDSKTFGYKKVRFLEFWLQKDTIVRLLATKGYDS